jgi:hypothetical protein
MWTVRQTVPPALAYETVLLSPGEVGSFNVYGADYDALRDQACPSTAAALIALPDGNSAVAVKVRIPDCPYPLDVAPVISGATDIMAWSSVVGVKTPPTGPKVSSAF